MVESRHTGTRRARARPRAKRAARRVRLEVVECDGDWSSLQPLAPVLERLVEVASAHLPANRLSPGVAALALSSDATVRTLNRRWRGRDEPTNVLSFPTAPLPSRPAQGLPFLGDIVIAVETLFREAAAAQVEPMHHFQHLVIHGLLHLLGYDHGSEREAAEMEALEVRILGALGIANPYAESDGSPTTATPLLHVS
ncbi:MAG TPA: rRNA maturation RNase YbeY [Hyphomicrobiaceae bacterium]|nr:rRNA maturation RNase YbeY [Hyphomicrobiaceae bacterium]